MATEYGHMFKRTGNVFWCASREEAEDHCRNAAHVLVAREVSEPRIVSIRA